MEKEYKFVSKFVEGKTYNELTDEEIEKLKSGVGVKKEDKEYMESLEKTINELREPTNNEIDSKTEEPIQELEKEETTQTEELTQEIEKNDIVSTEIEESTKQEKKGITVIKASGKTLELEDGRTIKLNKEELKEKSFWRRGDVYYG